MVNYKFNAANCLDHSFSVTLNAGFLEKGWHDLNEMNIMSPNQQEHSPETGLFECMLSIMPTYDESETDIINPELQNVTYVR